MTKRTVAVNFDCKECRSERMRPGCKGLTIEEQMVVEPEIELTMRYQLWKSWHSGFQEWWNDPNTVREREERERAARFVENPLWDENGESALQVRFEGKNAGADGGAEAEKDKGKAVMRHNGDTAEGQARTNNTYVFNQTGACSSDTTAQCIQQHGGGFDKSSSSTWSQLSTYIASESVISTTGDEYGSDTLVFAGQNLSTYPIGLPLKENGLGLNDVFDNALGLGSNSTFLTALSNVGLIASRSFSIFWGLTGTTGNTDGSLIVGGLDSAKMSGSGLTGPISPQNSDPVSSWTNNCGTGLFVTVKDISLNFPNGSTPSILGGNFTQGLSMCIDPAYPGITLPPNTNSIINEMLGTPIQHIGADEAGDNNIPFYNSDIYLASDVYQGDLTFTFESGLQIAVTNDQLVVPVWEINKNGIAVQNNDTLRRVLINPLGWPIINDQPILGQTFLTAAYLSVNYDSNEFTIANVNVTESSNIVAIGPSGTCIPQPPMSITPSGSNTTITSDSSTSIAPGAIAGIVIGTVVILAILAIGLLFFLRRRKAQQHSTPYPTDPKGPTPPQYAADPKSAGYAGELPAGEHPKELPGGAAWSAELPPGQDFRMAQELPT
ncbi:hypothetical protein MMC26_006028 [Xylographa opegraphella]|nr:hypothetical protein [Xylographa opegraphella]